MLLQYSKNTACDFLLTIPLNLLVGINIYVDFHTTSLVNSLLELNQKIQESVAKWDAIAKVKAEFAQSQIEAQANSKG